MPDAPELRPWRRALAWLAVLGPLFFLSYGWANARAASLTAVPSVVFSWERALPFLPWSIVPYWSIDAFYTASFFLCTRRAELDRHGLRLLTAQLVAVACFVLWPLHFSFTRPPVEGLPGWLFQVLLGFDQPFNQAPSLHIVLLVVLWAKYAEYVPRRWRWLLHGWAALIGVSVLTTWQHHFLDVPTGALAGLLCLWLWPNRGPSPLAAWRRGRSVRHGCLAAGYLAASLACAGLAMPGAAALWLLWPAVSLLLVALAYAGLDVAVFQKRADGRLSVAAGWLLAPYRAAAWLNARCWTRRHPTPAEVVAGVWLGRLPGRGEPLPAPAIVDVCAELACRAQVARYTSVPMLDLVTPPVTALRAAARAITAARRDGPVLVCCALGYARSAAALATWLLREGLAADVDEAVARLEAVAPRVVLTPATRAAIAEAAA